MERLAINDLVKWKNSPYRKPLILEGARQVGKTWLLVEFGKRYYKNEVYFNFDRNPEYKQFFEITKDTTRILQNLSFACGQPIEKNSTLIIFDEIQDSPEVINTLKYFYEDNPEYHIACAGSLLGLRAVKPSSFPVGKVDFLKLNPMTFTEFLLANNNDNLVSYLDSINSIKAIPDAFFNLLYEKFKMYLVIGGMPEAVSKFIETSDINVVEDVLSNIIKSYEYDFSKHPKAIEIPKISLIWQSIPSQLARENKRFLYKAAKEGARAREYENALQWLVDSRIVNKIYRSTAPRLPVSAYDDISTFKIYLNDVGLLRSLAHLSPILLFEKDRLFTEFKGSLIENYVLESLVNTYETIPRYWSQTNPSYEVDFLIQRENEVFPVEVKSDKNIKSNSLQKYKELFKDDTSLRIRLSLDNLNLNNDVLNIPLFMTDYIDKMIEYALRDNNQ